MGIKQIHFYSIPLLRGGACIKVQLNPENVIYTSEKGVDWIHSKNMNGMSRG